MSHSIRKPDEPRVYPFNVGKPLEGWKLCRECFGYSRLEDFKHEPGCTWAETWMEMLNARQGKSA